MGADMHCEITPRGSWRSHGSGKSFEMLWSWKIVCNKRVFQGNVVDLSDIIIICIIMEENFHDISRAKVCVCAKKACRVLTSEEKAKVNEGRDDKIDFDRFCFPLGVCSKCEVSLRRKGKLQQIAYWEANVTEGMHQECIWVYVIRKVFQLVNWIVRVSQVQFT